MTKFEDQLFGQLMAEHGHKLRSGPRPAPARRRVRRPVWVATGAAGAAAAVTTAAFLALGSAPAIAAYSVTGQAGAVSVSVYNASGVAGADSALHRMHARVVVVPVRADCRPMASLPHPRPAPHLDVSVKEGYRHGHRVFLIKVKGRIPRGDTMILAFTNLVTAEGIITGPVPRCVSLRF